jgi:RNA polymerase sigma factor (sigma-70 family)
VVGSTAILERGTALGEEGADLHGGDEAFEAFFRRVLPSALRTAGRILGDPRRAEEAAVDALARAFADWDRVRRLTYREAWVLRVTANVAVDQLRSARPAEELADELIGLDPEFESVELRATLVPLLRGLPTRQRETIVLTYIAGLPRAEIAELLGTSENSVKTHLARALRQLRATIGARPATPGAAARNASDGGTGGPFNA